MGDLANQPPEVNELINADGGLFQTLNQLLETHQPLEGQALDLDTTPIVMKRDYNTLQIHVNAIHHFISNYVHGYGLGVIELNCLNLECECIERLLQARYLDPVEETSYSMDFIPYRVDLDRYQKLVKRLRAHLIELHRLMEPDEPMA